MCVASIMENNTLDTRAIDMHPAMVANMWKPGDPSPNPNGRPKGSKNRQTIAKEILELQHETGQTYEYVATKAVADKATAGDVTAWDKLMDSAYGKTTDVVDHKSSDRSMTPGVSRIAEYFKKKTCAE